MDDIQKIQIVGSNLKSKTKLNIIKHLSERDASNQEIFESVKKCLKVNYRSTIYAALKDLQDSGIIEKYYDNKNNKIKYHLIVRVINIDLENMKIELS